jgi:4-hydroxy-3-methylbut-2-enyl diphosphate reductase
MDILLAQPRGFCAGVVRAIETVEQALETYGAPVYVYHEIVHNRHVVESLRQRGAVFVEAVADVPLGAICIFSAHGVATRVVEEAGERDLRAIDATCPLVTKVHSQAQRYQQKGYEIIIVGHAGHPEVEGTRGRLHGTAHILCSIAEVQALQPADPEKLAYVTQTTLSVDDTRAVIDALTRRFPNIVGPDVKDICYATQNRQNAVRDLARQVEVLLVVGAANSSNSNRLREAGEQVGVRSYLIADAANIQPAWLAGVRRVGVTAGASAPEVLVQGVLEWLKQWGDIEVRDMNGEPETVTFKIPLELLSAAKRKAEPA